MFLNEQHIYSEQTFDLPINNTSKRLQCVLKRHAPIGRLRCFGSTREHRDAKVIFHEYVHRWTIENGIKDLVGNYYFLTTLVRIVFEMLARDYEYAYSPDCTHKSIDTLRAQFLSGANGILSKTANALTLTWQDPYPVKQYHALTHLFDKLSQESQDGLPFLGGIPLRFDIIDPNPQNLRNRPKRQRIEI